MASTDADASGVGGEQTQRGDLLAQDRRLASRRGKNRAIVAVGHTILVVAYSILRDAVAYHDLSSDHFDRLSRERTVSN